MDEISIQSEMKKPATLLAYKGIYLVMAAISFLPILLLLFLREG